ncbi:MAG: Adenosine monophosphate-protein transferase SoFic [Chlamydiae bacterium]|nr:Adenosine monophosphate-protein transferase SoFic [Chlamydiota bacterium]
MRSKFQPCFTITPPIANQLLRIERAKEKAAFLPLSPSVLSSLRETARLYTTHYSTMIEGNRLRPDEVKEVIEHQEHFPGREKDEQEVKGYYAALAQLERYAAQNSPVSEKIIQTFHAFVMNHGRNQVSPSPYREGQNVIREGATGRIVYMPPEAKDVPELMRQLVKWLRESRELPCPLVAAIAHYQFATIHPYYDGNGRTARLLTTFILHLGGYDLKGLYSLEEYYAKNLLAYYQAIAVGSSHNYYLGRVEADITGWIEYFCQGMAYACERVVSHLETAEEKGEKDLSSLLKTLDPKQRKALELFREHSLVTSKQIGELFGFKPRTQAKFCKAWVESGFLEIVDPSKKGRKYQLSKKYRPLAE